MIIHNRLLSGIFFISSPLCSVVATAIIIIVIPSLALLSSILVFKPVYAQEQIRLEAVTNQGTFKVEIMWITNDIGSANMFEIHFVDPDTGSEIEDIKYDVSIYRDDKPKIQRLEQTSISQEFFFEEMGSYEIRIDDIEDLGEGATVPIQVTPEFQLKAFVLSAAVAVGIAMLAARASNNGNNLFRHPIN